ncbi:MAG: efflux RND transporter periplasmic adaptor subunit [Saprospiraceae bacterium]|jgi:membrane fusion protein (multidrug efflux system)|nr:efflux RND transporter periplasmic adaptor subunit [Saprospiraceae bacterium]MBK9993138.1 efflux RND transporter periplasmic adaptor subunit [Saprospiraceae bacterium]
MKKQFICALLALQLIIIISCNHKIETHKEETKFLVTSPIMKDTTIYNEYVAQINSSNHIELRSQERGYLEKIYVDEGQFVKKGQLMFKIMPTIYQAEVAKAKAELNFEEIEYNNTKSLAEKNVVSVNELALAKAKVEKAKAELALAEAHLSFTEIRAPFDGIMDRFHTRVGSLLEEGELLTTLSDISYIWVYFNVPESEYLNYVGKGKNNFKSKVQLRLANKELFESQGSIETIEGEFNNETGNIAFRATFPNSKGLLRHGETGNILMSVNLKNAILIPQKSTFDILDKKYVYVVNAQNILQAKQITIANELDHLYVVGSGLSNKDKILADGLGKVKSNERIEYEFVSFEEEMLDLNQMHAE